MTRISRLTAINAQIDRLKSKAGPAADRLNEVIDGLIDAPQNPDLLKEFERLSNDPNIRKTAEERTKHIDRLLDEAVDVQAEMIRAERAQRDAESLGQRRKAVQKAEAMLPYAMAFQDAVDALVVAAVAMHEHQVAVGEEVDRAVMAQQPHDWMTALGNVQNAGRGRTALHGAAVVEVLRRVSTALQLDDRVGDYVAINVFSKTDGCRMPQAAASAAQELAERLDIGS